MTTIWFPIAGNGAPSPDATCLGNDKALAFYQLLVNDSRQQRTLLACCPAFVAAAQARARGLANGDPWGHVDAAGVGPNVYARRAGCVLPNHYGNNMNHWPQGWPIRRSPLRVWHARQATLNTFSGSPISIASSRRSGLGSHREAGNFSIIGRF